MYLHSNMVRFIICGNDRAVCGYFEFTFQYGQIYYINDSYYKFSIVIIYIPIWLDLLCLKEKELWRMSNYLHSNMVRFIINAIAATGEIAITFTFQYGQIYY